MTDGGSTITPSAPRLRIVLALLLLHNGHVVSPELIGEELWPHDRPVNSGTAVRTYVYQLGKLFNRSRTVVGVEQNGYAAHAERRELDLAEFEWLADGGRRALREGRVRDGSATLRRAVRLRSGATLCDVPHGPVLTPLVDAVETRVHAVEALTAAAVGPARFAT
ncbi:AfsR/SARP family transcriptional regulator [Umezawaea sp.]|uniref:AfsR/SARP family transcriptional regulator n=1 Tax=Umezawaea sp. TaxID=1955258 RepID=UPI002ED26ED3